MRAKRHGEFGNRVEFHQLAKQGPVIIRNQPRIDSRGYFGRLYCKQEFENSGITFQPIQTNVSMSESRGTIRGLHMQRSSHSETKLIRVLQGAIFDACVNLNRESPSYGEVFSVELRSDSHQSFLIPKGFAHGFQTLEDETVIEYMVDNYYNRESEVGILWNDESLNIKWPLEVSVISEKDKTNLTFRKYRELFE